MCREGDRVAAINGAMAQVSQKACKTNDAECQFYNICGYQAQQKLKPQVWVITHSLLFRERPAFISRPVHICIDESFWNQSLNGFDRPCSIKLNDLRKQRDVYRKDSPKQLDVIATNDLLTISQRIAAAIEADGQGRIRREALIAAGVTLDDVRVARKVEWRRKIELADVHPGMSLPQVHARCQKITEHNQQIARIAKFFDLLARTLETECDRSPWLEMSRAELPSEKVEQVISMLWRNDVHHSWNPRGSTTILNAATRPAVVKLFYPQVVVPTMHTAAMPYTHVMQVINKTMTEKFSMDHVEKIRRHIEVRASETAGKVLVVCQKKLEAALRKEFAGSAFPMPKNVTIAHFNATAGLNAWQDVELLIVIGRTEPPPRTVERIARVLWGCEVREVEPDERGAVWYPRGWVGIRMRDGSTTVVRSHQHPDWRAETVRWLICEAELIQAIGRGRGVRRTALNPLRIEVMCSIPLPLEVDEVTTWDEIQPSRVRVMWARGGVPLSYRDMAAAYPDLFKSAEAARKALTRETPDTPLIDHLFSFFLTIKGLSGVSSIAYRRAGSRGPATKLFYPPDRTPDPEAWLTKRLGPVVTLGEPEPVEIPTANLNPASERE
jgi:putative DNA primase/helicase